MAFFILFVVTLAVLQMLSMAYLVNLGSLIRTDLTYRAQRVVETIRLQRYRVQSPRRRTADPCCPVAAGSTQDDPARRLLRRRSGARTGRTSWSRTPATRSATRSTPAAPSRCKAVPLTTGANLYLGPAANKAVVYVAQLQ